uniref:Uncharacterized protein n=1 Tax=Oscillatoriales cyanobacterium SpSt-402 TaxID=2282168 RepID=A0A832M335_9CYAN
MSRNFPDLTSSLEWNLVGRDTLLATIPEFGDIIPIPRKSYFIENSHVLMIGCRSNSAPSRWYTAGWAEQVLPVSPSFTSDFVAAAQATSQRLRLGIQNLVVFPKYVPSYILQISFPRWMRDISLEVWQYDGPDVEGPISNQLVSYQIPASTSSVLLLPEREIRKGAVVVNNSTADLYLNLGPTADFVDYLALLVPGGYYETPFNYAGPISGIWTAAVATATVKEFF